MEQVKTVPVADGQKPERRRRAGAEPDPWPAAPPRGAHAEAGPGAGPGAAAALAPPPPLFGVERRLIRRAEALWEHLQGDRALPPACAVRAFETSAFASHSLFFERPAGSDGRACRKLRLHRVGSGLTPLVGAATGDIACSPAQRAPLVARLADLAERAGRLAEPAVMETEGAPAPTGRRSAIAAAGGGILLRAIALPFASRTPDGATTVIVVASWRQLLSTGEADALRRELAAAIDWLKGAL